MSPITSVQTLALALVGLEHLLAGTDEALQEMRDRPGRFALVSFRVSLFTV